MELKGQLENLSQDYLTRKARVSLVCEPLPMADLEKYKGRDLRVTLVEWREKRSLDANAYYWVLVGKMADALKVSSPRMHNLLLRRYGAVEQYGGQNCYVVIPDTDEAAERVLEAETYHLRPTSQVKEGTDGTMWRTYQMLKGSHLYDTKEMSRLIDGIVSECKEMGIETMTPEQIERMLTEYDDKSR